MMHGSFSSNSKSLTMVFTTSFRDGEERESGGIRMGKYRSCKIVTFELDLQK